MSDSKNPGAEGAAGASESDVLGGNRIEDTKPVDPQQARKLQDKPRATMASTRS